MDGRRWSSMTPEQQRRQDLQMEWLISALRRAAETRLYRIEDDSLGIPTHCHKCGARVAFVPAAESKDD